MSDLKSTQTKEVIHVLVNIGNHPNAKKLPDGKGYRGISYDIWKLMRTKLQNKYTFIEHFQERRSVKLILDDVSNDKYDIVIAPMQLTSERMKLVNFTNVIMTNRQAILHLSDFNIQTTFKLITQKIIVGPLLLVITIGIILGIVLHWVEPNRFIKSKVKEKLSLRRTITSSTAGFFNEKGFLSENSTMSASGVIMVIFIIIAAFFATMIIQSLITENVINLKNNKKYNASNIKGKVLLCLEGYATGTFMEQRYGAKIKYYKKSFNEIIDIYLRNKHKYIGIALEELDALAQTQINNKLAISNSEFGFANIHWIVNKKKTQFLEDFNMELPEINLNFTKYLVCKKYLPKDFLYMCAI